MQLPPRKYLLAGAAGLIVMLLASRRASAASGRIRTMLSPAWLASNKPSAKKLANVDIIEEVFRKYGYSDTVIAAAVANAWHESTWYEKAIGDGVCSVGLFQLNACGGAGDGLSTAYRQDPYNNTRTIIEREVTKTGGRNFRKRAAAGARVGELAYLFCRDIERPKKPHEAGLKRQAMAEKMFPSLA